MFSCSCNFRRLPVKFLTALSTALLRLQFITYLLVLGSLAEVALGPLRRPFARLLVSSSVISWYHSNTSDTSKSMRFYPQDSLARWRTFPFGDFRSRSSWDRYFLDWTLTNILIWPFNHASVLLSNLIETSTTYTEYLNQDDINKWFEDRRKYVSLLHSNLWSSVGNPPITLFILGQQHCPPTNYHHQESYLDSL